MRAASTASAMSSETLTWFAVGLPTITAPRRIPCAADLKILHSIEQLMQLRGKCVVVESSAFQCDENFVRRLQRGEASCLRLLLDDVSAGR